jgi:hypothetical protein
MPKERKEFKEYQEYEESKNAIGAARSPGARQSRLFLLVVHV